MTVRFILNYQSTWGQKVYICGNTTALGNDVEANALPLQYIDAQCWQLEIDELAAEIAYYYYVLNADGTKHYTATINTITLPTHKPIVNLYDTWCAASLPFTTFFTKPFKAIFYKTKIKQTAKPSQSANYIFNVNAPILQPNETVCVIGNTAKLGDWTTEKPLLLKAQTNGYTAQVQLPVSTTNVVYKYGIYNTLTKLFVTYESGEDRSIQTNGQGNEINIINDTVVGINYPSWKGAGVAIPVFSLRTKNGFGVGEFLDIKLLADWCKSTGLKLIQLLPINDTIAKKTNSDSYPYAANSSFALHPLYINIDAVGKLDKTHKLQKQYTTKKNKLNKETALNFEAVIQFKLSYLKELYLQDSTVLETEAYLQFYTQNKYWLQPYAAYCYLRDKHKTADFEQWGTNATVTATSLQKLINPKLKQYTEVSFWYFVQYHLHVQLKNAVNYTNQLGIAMKGDIPIGIGRTSCDAWQFPNLFNTNKQAGAPPDDFAVKGQNWGFPTYNWDAMQQDGFGWWKNRFAKMSDYFDAFRIDHILGFFRIWSIPLHAVEGIMGHFVPAIPVYKNEMAVVGLYLSSQRLCQPYCTFNYLQQTFGEAVENVINHFFTINENNLYDLKPDFDTQQKVLAYFALQNEFDQVVQYKLYDCIANIICFEEDTNQGQFHFNIAMEKTYSYNQLNGHEKEQLRRLYINYFYERQNEFWKIEANKKLPSIQHSTNMLVCGEDLGMVPNCVPGVMESLSMLSLEVQRMPKATQQQYVNLDTIPYLSVATPSTHDMSTLRAWWEEDYGNTQYYYNNILHQYGEAPKYAEPWIVQQIIQQHLQSNAMLSVFQLQDIMGIDGTLRLQNPTEERINEPSNPNHYWCYRMHLTLEELIKQTDFNTTLNNMIVYSGR